MQKGRNDQIYILNTNENVSPYTDPFQASFLLLKYNFFNLLAPLSNFFFHNMFLLDIFYDFLTYIFTENML